MGITPEFIIDFSDEDVAYPEFELSAYLPQELPKRKGEKRRLSIFNMPIEFFRDQVKFEKSPLYDFSDRDENGKPLVIGHDYAVEISKIMDEPEKYSVIISLLERETSELKQMYHRLKQYYQELAEKYKDSDNLDDDDF